MCLNPQTIRNPTKSIYKHGGQPLLLDVPCGNCAECKKNKRIEWRFRTYHEVESTVKNGGYVYFDTLTYAPEHVPHISDFVDLDTINRTIQEYSSAKGVPVEFINDNMCFNSLHWRNFLKNLRRQLDYHYQGIKFNYFLTSEYGIDERYTHRPHYHILFFVNSRSMSPYDFSALVSKCWSYGRTDGIPYKERNYVADHVFGYNLGTNSETYRDYIKVSNYVSKYITKDSTFQNEINNRINALSQYIDDEELTKVKRNIDMFHRQSHGFGLSFLNNLTSEEYSTILNDGTVSIQDSERVVVTLPLPNYYKRKLFYNLLRDDEGHYFWQPNIQGIVYLENSLKRNITNVAKRIYNIYTNSTDYDKQYIDTLLSSRNFFDLASYMVLYRSRFTPDVNNIQGKNIPVQLQSILNSLYCNTACYSDIFHRDVDSDIIYIPTNYGDLYGNNVQTHSLSYTNFLKNNIINENSSPAFANFDKLIAFINSLNQPGNCAKQKTFDFIEELTQKFKHLEKYGY